MKVRQHDSRMCMHTRHEEERMTSGEGHRSYILLGRDTPHTRQVHPCK